MKKLLSHCKTAFENNKATVLALSAIMAVGVFLRAYHFHDWLFFWDDQVRDARLIAGIVNGDTPWPLLGPHMLFTEYHLGPMYYYFQILSAKIFGMAPHVIAYPDLFFSILSIPLFFVFLRRYFDTRLSLGLTGLYSISFFAIRFSRFAWNTNPIPFFSILFLLSLHKLLTRKSETRWWWIALLGISIGVGIQLHAIVLLLMLATVGLAVGYTIWADRRTWRRWALVLLIVLGLNTGPILHDLRTDFSNSKAFVSALTKKSEKGRDEPLKLLGRDIDCHIQTSYHILTSFGGQDDCEFFYTGLVSKIAKNVEKLKSPFRNISLDNESDRYVAAVFGTIFLIFGFGILYSSFRREEDPGKKYFLGLILVYATLSFLVLFPVNEMLKPRYFMHASFLPLFLLGLVLKYVIERFPKRSAVIWIAIALVAAANLFTLSRSASDLIRQSASKNKNPILGELEMMIEYIAEQSAPQKDAFLAGTKENMFTFYAPLDYVGQEQRFKLHRYKDDDPDMGKWPIYYISRKNDDSTAETSKKNRVIVHYKEFGSMIIYELGDRLSSKK